MILAFRLARREMRSGLGGFRLFIACLALGVGAIAAIGRSAAPSRQGLRADAREILGGDVAISLLYREATPEQMAFMREQGESRALARQPGDGAPTRPTAAPTLVRAEGGRTGLSALRPGELAEAVRSPMRCASATGSGAPWSRNRRCAA